MLNKRAMILMVVLALAMALALALAGCGDSQPASSSVAASNASASTSESASASESSEATAPDSSSTAAEPANTAAQPSTDAYIGEDAAIAAALKDAGVAEADATELEAELDTDDAVVHYDVEFKAGGMEYDYDIDATTGEVISANSEADD